MYYPKNKIKTNLNTLGGEYYFVSNGEQYVGFYYKLASGKAYTGKFPGDGVNLPIQTKPEATFTTPTAPAIPTTIPPLFPTPEDYKNGMFTRYFSKKRNEYLFEELTKDQFDKLNNSKNPLYTLYKPFFIKWMLVGEKQTVADYNFYSIRNAEEKDGALGLNEFLKMNYLQYYK